MIECDLAGYDKSFLTHQQMDVGSGTQCRYIRWILLQNEGYEVYFRNFIIAPLEKSK